MSIEAFVFVQTVASPAPVLAHLIRCSGGEWCAETRCEDAVVCLYVGKASSSKKDQAVSSLEAAAPLSVCQPPSMHNPDACSLYSCPRASK